MNNLILLEMMNRPNWVLWRKEIRNGRTTKVPYQINGYGASSTNANHWTNYELASVAMRASYNKYDGVGYVFRAEDNLVFVDIDHCIDENGILSDLAREILDAIGQTAYWEISQSGHGLHAFVKGRIPEVIRNGEKVSGSYKNTKLGLEIYDRARYVAFTGDTFTEVPEGKDYPIVDAGDGNYENGALLHVWSKFNPYKDREKDEPLQRAGISSMSDSVVLAHCLKNGKFQYMYQNGWDLYPSQSEAELAFCNIVAFWSNRDPEVIDRLMRTSALYREKWNRDDYRSHTIAKAVNGCREDFDEYVQRVDKERRDRFAKYLLH